jgi:transcriptional enhancer factor
MHMSTQDLSGKRQRHSSSHLSHVQNRQQPYTQPGSKYELSSQGGMNYWQGIGTLPSVNVLANVRSESDAPYTVENFTMHVHDSNKDPVHHYAQLSNPIRQQDLHVTDTTSWHKQYPELNFHRTDELKDRHVLVCDSSIKIMTEVPHKSDKLAIDFVLKSSHDIDVFEPLQSRTRFYDSGVLVDQYDEQKPEYQAETGRLFMPFGSKFWAERLYTLGKSLRDARMSELAGVRARAETDVRRSLQYMTAVQDISSANRETGEQHCFLTVLWRFNQTKSANEAGKMMWRVVNFTQPQQLQQRWIKPEGIDAFEDPKVSMPIEGINLTTVPPPTLYPVLSLDFHQHPYAQHPPQLDLDSLDGITLEGMTDFSHPNSATAPSMSTDYSQHSLPSLSHSQENAMSQAHDYSQDPNDFDFHGGHINITGCLEPAINLGQYENYTQAGHQSITPLIPIAGMEHLGSSNDGFGDLGLNMGGAVMQNCYSTKPSWHYADLISRLEGAAEQTHHGVLDQSGHGVHEMHGHDLHGQDIAGHSVLHGGQMGDGMWKLQQSAFEHDAGKEDVHGLGILQMIERDQRRDSLRDH